MLRPPLPDRPFTTAEAAGLGLSAHELRRQLLAGTLRRPFRGVYLPSTLPDTAEVRAQAARLVMSEHSVLCDLTAAWLHGVDAYRWAQLQTEPMLDSYVLRGHDPTDRAECHGGSRDLVPDDWQWVHGVRVTTPLRTAVDLACELRRRDAMAALDAIARESGVTVPEMERLLRRYRRRRGVVQARELVPLTDPRSESSGESWARLEIHDRRLPPPKPQHWIVIAGVPTFRLDLAYVRARVVVEYDGEEFHTEPEDQEADERRRDWLRRHGWYVIVLTKESFTEAACQAWTGELWEVLRERGVNLR